MSDEDLPGVGLQEAIESIRTDLLAARASGEDADIRFPIGKITVELEVVATTVAGGKAGFKIPVVNIELGGEGSRTWSRSGKVTVELAPAVDRDGNPILVADESEDELH